MDMHFQKHISTPERHKIPYLTEKSFTDAVKLLQYRL